MVNGQNPPKTNFHTEIWKSDKTPPKSIFQNLGKIMVLDKTPPKFGGGLSASKNFVKFILSENFNLYFELLSIMMHDN